MVGRIPTRLLAEEGERTELMVSVPSPMMPILQAMEAPVPPEEPPGVRVGRYGGGAPGLNRPRVVLAGGPAFPAAPCVSRGLRHSGIFASRSRFFRSFQSGITSATTAWNAGEWFACTRCASSCTIM